MPHRILNEDWSDYDNRKKIEDRLFFSCEEAWEVDYLLDKIRKYVPHKTDAEIRQAILSCCTEIPAPRPRNTFVTCLMENYNF
jgi:hypothetical protein